MTDIIEVTRHSGPPKTARVFHDEFDNSFTVQLEDAQRNEVGPLYQRLNTREMVMVVKENTSRPNPSPPERV